MSEGNTNIFKVPSLPQRSAAERAPPLDYDPPANAAPPSHQFTIDVIKDGSFVDAHIVSPEKSYSTFGRLPICDYPMDHGSISRYHAVLQFTKDAALPSIVDLGSSHGTFVNKRQIQARVPQTLSIGDQVRFGASSRIWILSSSDPSLRETEGPESGGAGDTRGIVARGMSGDEEEEDDMGEGSSNSRYGNGIRPGWRPNKHAEYRKDPIGYLRSMLHESGHEYSPEHPADELSKDDDEDNALSLHKRQRGRQITVRIELPFSDEHGNILFGTAQSTRQADAERLACLDALEELDKRGYLNTDSSYYSKADTSPQDKEEEEEEEEDDFYDQTKSKASTRSSDNGVETFDTLSRKLLHVREDIDRVQRELAALSTASAVLPSAADEDDELDAYMHTLARGETADSQRRLSAELEDLVAQKARLDTLLKIVAPDHSEASPAPDHPRDKPPAPVSTPTIVPAVSVDKTQSAKRQIVHGPSRESASNSLRSAKHAKTGDAHIENSNIIDDSANVSWQPPVNQSGDGRTSLNDKYGY